MSGFANSRPAAGDLVAVVRTSVVEGLRQLGRHLARSYNTWNTARQLNRLSDWELEDIGLAREQIEIAVRRRQVFHR